MLGMLYGISFQIPAVFPSCPLLMTLVIVRAGTIMKLFLVLWFPSRSQNKSPNPENGLQGPTWADPSLPADLIVYDSLPCHSISVIFASLLPSPLPPQGLCTYCSLSLECSSLDSCRLSLWLFSGFCFSTSHRNRKPSCLGFTHPLTLICLL